MTRTPLYDYALTFSEINVGMRVIRCNASGDARRVYIVADIVVDNSSHQVTLKPTDEGPPTEWLAADLGLEPYKEGGWSSKIFLVREGDYDSMRAWFNTPRRHRLSGPR